jgi:hypothetical protein
MAKVLVETPVFGSETVTVPELTDTMDDSALVVEAFSQVFANRSQWLKQRITSYVALLAGNNVFTGTNTFNAAVIANNGISATDGSLELNGTSVRVAGALSVSGGITAPDGTVEVTSALVAQSTIKATGAITANGGIRADDGTVEITSNVAGANIALTGNLTFPNATSDIVYTASSLPLRWLNIPLHMGRLIGAAGHYDDLFDTWGLTAGGGPATIRFPVLGLPRGAVAILFGAAWRAHAMAAANTITLRMNSQAAWTADPAAPTDPVDLGTIDQASFSATQVVHTWTSFLPALHTVNNATDAYFIDIKLMYGPNNALFGVRVGYLDPGARNG